MENKMSVVWCSMSILPLMLTLSNGLNTIRSQKRPILINFGDSNSDTGGLQASGLRQLIDLPYGMTFFHRCTSRFSDGRLIIDFFYKLESMLHSSFSNFEKTNLRHSLYMFVVGEHLNLGYLSPCLDSLAPNFTSGVNFAVAGSSLLPEYFPVTLSAQVRQFIRFKNRSLELVSLGSRDLIDEEGFHSALYMLDIGQNDLAKAIRASNLSYGPIAQIIPSLIEEISLAVKTIYQYGGRKFWIHNVRPLGCLPIEHAVHPHKSTDLDRFGCFRVHNQVVKTYNTELRSLSEYLRLVYEDAVIVYVDVYTIQQSLFANLGRYGFKNPFAACCGHGAPYFYDRNVTCGQPGSSVCSNVSQSIYWDEVHCTEAANHAVATKILSGRYSTPRVKLEHIGFCTEIIMGACY